MKDTHYARYKLHLYRLLNKEKHSLLYHLVTGKKGIKMILMIFRSIIPCKTRPSQGFSSLSLFGYVALATTSSHILI